MDQISIKRVNHKQKEFLIDFMGSNYDFLFGKFANSHGKESKEKIWIELCTQLNEFGPPKKGVSEWKKVREWIYFIPQIIG